MTAPDLLRAVVAALPDTDPVGAICAALWRYDRETAAVIDDLAHDLAKALGQSEAALRHARGLEPLGDPGGRNVAPGATGRAVGGDSE